MTPENVAKAMESGGALSLIDVRDPKKYADSHLPGARNIPLAELESHVDELRGGGPVLVY